MYIFVCNVAKGQELGTSEAKCSRYHDRFCVGIGLSAPTVQCAPEGLVHTFSIEQPIGRAEIGSPLVSIGWLII